MRLNKMKWEINEGRRVPSFMFTIYERDKRKRELKYVNPEWGYPKDRISLEILRDYPDVALFSAVDGRGTNDGSPAYNKFICYSFDGKSQIMTTYQAYLFNGSVVVEAWDEKKKHLLENIDMFSIDITPDRVPDKVIGKHLERIAGKECIAEGLRGMAEKTFFDMLWNIPSY
jgi:hypothetical protein